MVCCIIAAYLYRMFLAMLRRWAIYWGLARPLEWEQDLPTFAGEVGAALKRAFRSKAARIMALALVSSTLGLTAFFSSAASEAATPSLASLLP